MTLLKKELGPLELVHKIPDFPISINKKHFKISKCQKIQGISGNSR